MKIEVYKLSARLRNILNMLHIQDTDELKKWTKQRFLECRNVGIHSFRELRSYLKKNGIEWESESTKDPVAVKDQINIHFKAISKLMEEL